MRLSFYGAARTVTGSCFLAEVSGMRVLVDCGLFQGPPEVRERNFKPFPFLPAAIDFLLLTHAHIDHSGLIPRLCREGFRGKILATEASVDLLGVLLPDAAHIQEMETEQKNRKGKRAGKPPLAPLYTVADAARSLQFLEGVGYETPVSLSPGVTATFLNAGHILGASMILLTVNEGSVPLRVLFSGDVGRKGQRFLKDPVTVDAADYVIMESTYGNRLHPEENELSVLREVIWRAYNRGGNVIIPAFAVERTQDLLYDLSELNHAGGLPPVKVYIDSPLASAVTSIFNRHRELYDQETQSLIRAGLDPLNSDFVHFSVTTEESRALNESPQSLVIISASGMCEAGRIRHHLKHNLWRPESAVVFVGFQPVGTLGRRILDGERSVTIFGEEIAVRAEIVELSGYSAHADQPALINWLSGITHKPRQVFVVHGEPDAAEFLRGRIESGLGIKAVVPDFASSWTLVADVRAEALWDAYRRLGDRIQETLRAADPAETAEIVHRLEAVFNGRK
ncbi:MAG: MBL fold metallo-hydrolase [Ammonifex sp.]|nr:MAG: MBL fold metallo-hydrolase [Ammonifex sp.]